MWVNDLKSFKQTICEPNISLNGKILEKFEIDGVVYRASMFRTARGNVQVTTKMDPMFFICVGELLGMIHHVSTKQREIGMNYKRKSMSEIFNAQKEKVWNNLSPEIQEKVETLSQDLGKSNKKRAGNDCISRTSPLMFGVNKIFLNRNS